MLRALMLLLAAAGASGLAGEASLPVKMADFDLPLTVQESAGVERRGDVCSTGVPLPLGLIQEPEGIALYDDKDVAVPAQFRALERWRDFGEDKSIKWLLVTFLADVPKGGKMVYHLKAGKNPAPAKPVKIEEKGDAYEMGGQVFKKDFSSPFKLVLTDADGKELTAADVPVTWSVWESGPVRSCLKAESPTVPGKFGFIAWIYAFAGQDRWDMTVVLKNTPQEFKGPFYFKDFSVVWAAEQLNGAKDFLLGGEAGKAIAGQIAGQSAYLYQASNGTDNWGKMGDNEGNSLGLRGATPEFRGYKAFDGDKELGAGNVALGWVGLNGGGRGALACTRYFRPQFPKAVEVEPGKIVVRLWPKQWKSNGGLHWLDDATRKACDVSFRLKAGPVTAQEGDEAARSLDSFLVAYAPSAWYRSILKLPVDVAMWNHAPNTIAGSWNKAQTDNWVAFPRGRPNYFRYHYAGGSLNSYALTGLNPAAYYLFSYARLSSGMVPLWTDDCQYPRDTQALMSLAYVYCVPVRNLYVQGHEPKYREPKYRPETSFHMWMSWNYAHFFCDEIFDGWRLFGDPLVLDAVNTVGSYCQAYVDMREGPLWKEAIPGLTANGANWKGGGSPGAGGGERGEGCAFMNLCEAYRITGSESMLASLRRLAAVSWKQVDKQRGSIANASGYGVWMDPSMQSQVMDGLLSYYLVTHDETTADEISGQLDWIIAEGTTAPVNGLKYNHLYHAPITDARLYAECRKRYSGRPTSLSCYNFQIDPFLYAFVYGGTGDKRYKDEWDMLNNGRKDAKFDQFAGFLCAVHYKSTREIEGTFSAPREGAAPEPVKDLAAEALGGGKVRLTWTTPKGAPVRYQVKWDRKAIVERLLFDADKRAFQIDPKDHANWWAANNVEGEPKPGAAGAAESMVVEGVSVGRRFFAVRSFDAASNRSAMGNVAEVAVKGDPARPVITSDLVARTLVGEPFKYAIAAENTPTSYAATKLPAGLSLDPAAGVISGAPTAPTTGDTSLVEISATNAVGAGKALLRIYVIQPPAIAVQPESQTVSEGEKATFRVKATGTSLWCRWLKNGAELAVPGEGVPQDVYTTPPAKRADDGTKYSVVVGNEVGEVTSVEVALTVKPAGQKAQ